MPTDALRSQLARKFLTLGVLKHPEAQNLGDAVLYPSVCILRHVPTTPAEVEELFARSTVIVTASRSEGPLARGLTVDVRLHRKHRVFRRRSTGSPLRSDHALRAWLARAPMAVHSQSVISGARP